MANLILDERDQKFLLYEMFDVETLLEQPKFEAFSREMLDMILEEARKFAVNEIFPTLKSGDTEGCRLENGQVHVPKAFHRCYKLYCEGGWGAMSFLPESGGQGLPHIAAVAVRDWFVHNFAFFAYPGLTEGAARLVESYGTPEQKKRYLGKMITGEWGGTMCLTEPNAGTDVGNSTTRAVRQPDGTYRIQGTKIFISSGDHDLAENIVHPLLARIEGDVLGTKGLSIFLVPKYLVNEDGSLGRRNDYEVAKIEEKMGIHGSATCLLNFGDNGDCYAELLGEERQGMKIMFQMMNEARIGVGMQGVTSASIAYLHALQYAKERIQGSSIMDFKNPEAPRVPIIQHPDVRRMLLWMKSNVESMRALLYYTTLCGDRAESETDEAQKEKWRGMVEVLTPICKAYNSDIGFRVTETAIQVYGGYGYCSEYPVEQFLRDEKIASIYEGANGIQALDLVGRKLAQKNGAYFMSLIGEMNDTIARYREAPHLKDLADNVQKAVAVLGETGFFFAQCAGQKDFLTPVNNAYPFLMMMGKVIAGWFLLWEAGVATEKLNALSQEKGVDSTDPAAWQTFIKGSKEAAFYSGKVFSARYFIQNILPEAEAASKGIKSKDMSVVEIPEEGFAS
ncbi:MAG: acyl-CoA dehydrogenase [Deltaproteobacteria bacterium]|nr:acyl-CoA dehydrogenase [Deltaproteobacteria bacterium]